jgi:hypothetical protein
MMNGVTLARELSHFQGSMDFIYNCWTLIFQMSPLDHGGGNNQFSRKVSVLLFLNPKKRFLDFGMFLKEIVGYLECLCACGESCEGTAGTRGELHDE